MQSLITKGEELGMQRTDAENLEAVFLPMIETLKSFDVEYNALAEEAGCEITETICKKAKVLRLKIAKVRIATEKARLNKKEHITRAGKAVDGFANIVKNEVIEKEQTLAKVEKHYENLELERIAELEQSRLAELDQYEIPAPTNIGNMDQATYDIYISGVKSQHEAKLLAEEKAEAARIENERAETERRDRIQKENARLKKEAEAQKIKQDKIDAEHEKERMAAAKAQNEADEEVRKAREQQAVEAREAREKINAIENERAEERAAVARKEQAEQARINALNIAENKRKQMMADASDTEKLLVFRSELCKLELPKIDDLLRLGKIKSLLNEVAAICKGNE